MLSALSLSAYFIGLYAYNDATAAMTMAFGVISCSQLVHVLNQRSNVESVFAKGNGHNKVLFFAMAGSAAIMACILFIPPIQAFFSLKFLTWEQYLISAALALMPLLIVEIAKAVQRATAK